MEADLTTQLKTTFRALKYRNYRLFFFGQLISLTGTWVESVAISWLIYELTGSALLMGTISFITSIPTLFTPFSGVIVDRYNKYKMLIICQICFMIQASIMAYLTLTNRIEIWHIITLGLILSSIISVEMPLRQSLVVNLVDDHNDLSNAISLNSSCFNFARLVGPAVGGFLVAAVGVGICFLINALSFIPVIIAICFMTDNQHLKHDKKEGIFIELKNGLKYIKQKNQILNLIIFLAVISMLGMSYPLMLPILTKDIYMADARLLGCFMSSAGLGALIVTLLMASKKTINKMPEFLISSSFLLSLSFVLMGFSKIKLLSILIMFFLGSSVVACLIIINTLIQYSTTDEKRGRVMSIHALAFAGTIPFGNLLTGFVAEHTGISNTFFIYGFLILLLSLFFFKKIIKAEYREDID